MKTVFITRLFISSAAMLCLLALPLVAQTTAQGRESITARLAELRKIHRPEGIEALEEVAIGGARQWVSMRGKNRANPVLLFIHGGPGTPMLPMTWAYQSPWEDFFTVVQWDQARAFCLRQIHYAAKPNSLRERILAAYRQQATKP
jgi:hypothetical protein